MIVKSMKDHLKSEDVQILGCKILNNLIVGGESLCILKRFSEYMELKYFQIHCTLSGGDAFGFVIAF